MLLLKLIQNIFKLIIISKCITSASAASFCGEVYREADSKSLILYASNCYRQQLLQVTVSHCERQSWMKNMK